ncbi:MAG TPA: DUF1998 domain-containing protein [Candidatus Saccharimonadales bacterium]|nr:DUF1998 domain-containing protein [Candidatus Saccharimonadales bacterium]
MTTTGAQAQRTQRTSPTRIGGARPSHLVTTGGIGSIIDLPSMSVIVRGLNAWKPEQAQAIVEPRLLSEVRAVLGGQVRALRKAPWDPNDAEDPWARTGVPVSPFPRWLRCPRCHRLGPMDPPGQFSLVHRWGRRPDLAKWVHSHCQNQGRISDFRKKACLPARFLVVCERGHLDEFPFVEFVHRGAPCLGPKLTMRDSASSLGPRVTVKCEECGASRNISETAGVKGRARLPRCRGRHPHLQRFEPCGAELRLMVLGASNLWFSVTARALHLPHGESIEDRVAGFWDILGELPNADVVGRIIDVTPTLGSLRDYPLEDLWQAIERMRHQGGPSSASEGGTGLLDAEWDLLSRPTTDRQDEDFRAEPTPTPPGYDWLLDQVVQVPRLRSVAALVGFTRIMAPERNNLNPVNLLPLSTSAPDWVPAVEQRGEGIFLQLKEDRVKTWCETVDDHQRIDALRQAYQRWAHNRGFAADPRFPIARFVLLHTLSHLLIREVSLECGYSSASIRERLYTGTSGEPAAGILLSTAASDSEGTLGGLVALGEARYLKRLLDQALESAERCSADPLCAEHVPIYPSDVLHGGACHACLFTSETSCEANNRWLDRAVLVDLTRDGLAFPR